MEAGKAVEFRRVCEFVYIPFKHRSVPSILRASVEARKNVAAASAVPSRQSVSAFLLEQERVFLSSLGWNALARDSPSSDLSIEQKKSEEKRLRYLNKHIRVSVRQRFNFDSTDDVSTREPVYLTSAEAQARITDLTAYQYHISWSLIISMILPWCCVILAKPRFMLLRYLLIVV